MFKYFIISLVLLLIIFSGCSTTSPDSLIEEERENLKQKQQDFEREKINKNTEKNGGELLTNLDNGVGTKETVTVSSTHENDLKTLTKQTTAKNFKLEQHEIFNAGLIDKTNSGHMLDRFELIPDEKTPFLTFKGFFDPDQFPHINISTNNSKKKTIVLLPNTFINSVLLPKREVTSFSEKGILEKMLLEEEITKKENGEIEFQVTITITSVKEHILVLDSKKSDSRHLTFTLKKPLLKKETDPFIEAMQMLADQQKPERKIIDLAPPKISQREAILLHPVTALMSYRRVDQLNLTILNASPHPDSAQRLAVLLNRKQKRNIEKQIGMKLKIINISSVREQTILPKTKIYFHSNLMREALILAQILPGEQVIEQMPEIINSKLATDMEIYVGKNFE